LNSSWENASLPGAAQSISAAAAIDSSVFLNMIAPPKPTDGFRARVALRQSSLFNMRRIAIENRFFSSFLFRDALVSGRDAAGQGSHVAGKRGQSGLPYVGGEDEYPEDASRRIPLP
jgi:hypothetical protein